MTSVKRTPPHAHISASMPRQQGIALVVVMVMLLLGTVLVLGASRTNWLNEAVVGSESDYHRAYAAAEALMRDAETDVTGQLPGGGPITPNNPLFFEGSGRLATAPFFPFTPAELDTVIANFNTLGLALPAPAGIPPCREGICIPATENQLGAAWWDNPVTLAAMLPLGATYGQFSGAANDPNAVINPLLRGPNTTARYWVEIFAFTEASPNAAALGLPLPNKDGSNGQPYFFRITALVQGLKPGTRVVLRTVFVPRPGN